MNPHTQKQWRNMQTFKGPFLLHLFTQEPLIKSLAQFTHPWIGDYRKPTIGFKVDKQHRMCCWHKRFSQNHWCLLACWLALQSKAATAEKKTGDRFCFGCYACEVQVLLLLLLHHTCTVVASAKFQNHVQKLKLSVKSTWLGGENS